LVITYKPFPKSITVLGDNILMHVHYLTNLINQTSSVQLVWIIDAVLHNFLKTHRIHNTKHRPAINIRYTNLTLLF